MDGLLRIVEAFGVIVSPLYVINGNPRFAFVSYATLKEANTAIHHLHNQMLDGSQIAVKLKSRPHHLVTPNLTSVPPPPTPR